MDRQISMSGSSIRRRSRLALVTGIVFLGAALVAEVATRQQSGLITLWPANAVLVAMLVMLPRGRADVLAMLAAAGVSSLVSCIVRGQPPGYWVSFPCADLIESSIAATMLRRFGRVDCLFDRVADVLVLLLACLVAPIPSATIGTAAFHLHQGDPFWAHWLNWYATAALNLAIVTPLMIMPMRLVRQRSTGLVGVGPLEAATILALVALPAIGIFYLTSLPLLFVMPPLLLLATFRLRQIGAVAAIAILALISAYATASNHGPIAAASAVGAERLILLQLFLAVTFATALPVAATLSERDARATEAQQLAERYRAVVENIDEVIFRTDRDGRWTYLNPAWEMLSGFTVAAYLGRSWLDRIEPDQRAELEAWAEPILAGEVEASRRLLQFRTAQTGSRWMELSLYAQRDERGVLIGATGMLRDVDDRKRLEERVLVAKRRAEERAREATLLVATDELTGLASRRAFMSDLNRQIAAAGELDWALTIAIFDVDHFKQINDRYGHAVGDQVLRRLGERASRAVRFGDIVGRLGGEEFAILMPGANLDDAAIVAERLRNSIEHAQESADDLLPGVTVSIGIAAYQTASELLRSADAALYEAKAAGRNRVEVSG